MTEKGTKTLIGTFVMGAVMLLVAGVLLIGSGALFSRNSAFVLYFDTSLRGLVAGSPVYFKGVRVGKVRSIQISMEGKEGDFRTPVVIELEGELIFGSMPGMAQDDDFMDDPVAVQQLIKSGLRARLGMQSFITGQLTVDLDMIPNAPPVDLATLQPYRGIMQLPTLPSSLDAMFDVITDLPIADIAHEVLLAVRTLNKQLTSLDLAALTSSLTALSIEMRNQVAELPVVRQEAVTALHQVAVLATNLDRDSGIALKKLDVTLTSINQLSLDASKTMHTATQLFSENSAPMLELSQTMEALRNAAQSISSLAILLELKPDALIFGRTKP